MNSVNLMGRLTKDPDIRFTQNGLAVARFTLAINRPYKKDKEQEADFINCIAFGKTAEVIGYYVFKGHRLIVEGRIQTGHYKYKEGNTKYTTEIAVNRCEFVEKRSETSSKVKYHEENKNASTGDFDRFGTEVEMEQGEIPF